MNRHKIHRRHAPEVRLWRTPLTPALIAAGTLAGACVNLRRTVIHHSPDGFEWGYTGSGPADLALEIMSRCLPPGCDGQPPERCFRGHCSVIAFKLHQGYKLSVISRVPHEGGTILADLIDGWIDGALAELTLQGYFSGDGSPSLPRYADESTAKR